MSIAYVMTNVPRDKLPQDFKTHAIDLVAEITGKPANWCCVLINGDIDIRMHGSDDPAVIFVVRANGSFDTAKSDALFGKAAAFFKRTLGVVESRTYCEFSERDVDLCSVGGFSMRQYMAQYASGDKPCDGGETKKTE